MPKHKPMTDETGEVRELLMEDLKRFRPALDVLPASSSGESANFRSLAHAIV
jgi:hypothetical protein